MSTFLLLHGSGQGGWIWKAVGELLRAAGHEVYRPTMDGCAERKGMLRPELTLADQGAEVANLLFYEDLRDVVCVATSTGGMVLCQAAPQVPERIGRLVFIDAIVPLPGETAAMINKRTPPPAGKLAKDPPPWGIFTGVPGKLGEWAVARYTPHPLRPTEEPVDLKDFWALSWQADVVRCRHSERPLEEHQRRTAERLNATYTELEAGHYPMLTSPTEVAEYLLALEPVASAS
ncbi:Alpha/beta hydrolase [Frankia sp. Hr75.2]|nr:Alpha/beta hydrolase [Frankia sp. Hr75.2]